MIQMSNTYQELSTTIGEGRPAILSLTIPDLPFPALRHSHSIILSDLNALNSALKFFLHTMKNRLPGPSEICDAAIHVEHDSGLRLAFVTDNDIRTHRACNTAKTDPRRRRSAIALLDFLARECASRRQLVSDAAS
jgi:hypothetical protein